MLKAKPAGASADAYSPGPGEVRPSRMRGGGRKSRVVGHGSGNRELEAWLRAGGEVAVFSSRAGQW